MKKWLIPIAALGVVAVIALVTWQVVFRGADKDGYKLYMIALGDHGRQGSKVGCGDSLVAVTRQVVSDTHITDVYQDIVDMHDQNYNDTGLTNSLYQSNLQYESAIIDATGVARIDLNGTLVYADTCQAKRIKAQLEKPAYQFEGVSSVDIRINDVALDDLLKL